MPQKRGTISRRGRVPGSGMWQDGHGQRMKSTGCCFRRCREATDRLLKKREMERTHIRALKRYCRWADKALNEQTGRRHRYMSMVRKVREGFPSAKRKHAVQSAAPPRTERQQEIVVRPLRGCGERMSRTGISTCTTSSA